MGLVDVDDVSPSYDQIGKGRFFAGYIFRTTSVETTTTEETVKTAAFCAGANAACGRRRRRSVAMDNNVEALHILNGLDADVKSVIKRSADNADIDLSMVDQIKWTPSRASAARLYTRRLWRRLRCWRKLKRRRWRNAGGSILSPFWEPVLPQLPQPKLKLWVLSQLLSQLLQAHVLLGVWLIT